MICNMLVTKICIKRNRYTASNILKQVDSYRINAYVKIIKRAIFYWFAAIEIKKECVDSYTRNSHIKEIKEAICGYKH